MYLEITIIEHAMSNNTVDTCVTVANRSRVGILKSGSHRLIANCCGGESNDDDMNTLKNPRFGELESFKWVTF